MKSVQKLKKEFDTAESFEIYQLYFDISNGGDLKDIKKNNKLGWNSDSLINIRLKQDEKEKFLTEPISVEEGIFLCICGSRKTFSYTQQTRSADEPMSVFVMCSVCKKSWRES